MLLCPAGDAGGLAVDGERVHGAGPARERQHLGAVRARAAQPGSRAGAATVGGAQALPLPRARRDRAAARAGAPANHGEYLVRRLKNEFENNSEQIHRKTCSFHYLITWCSLFD